MYIYMYVLYMYICLQYADISADIFGFAEIFNFSIKQLKV